ncbi:uncharacterized protein HKW66_Vig0150750 [Vigna angularis]|uniref:Uncharacterized protein n=1 Tax=Phaseolus angularis TaxID=3914 RepID=A0A8T0JTZ5_PHAAN|nr:uncharacterized protein HKW66_Vig0150750 [Vigna angularis]
MEFTLSSLRSNLTPKSEAQWFKLKVLTRCRVTQCRFPMIMELPDSTGSDCNLNALQLQPQHNNHHHDARSGLRIDLNEIPSPSSLFAKTLPDSATDIVRDYDENPGPPPGAPLSFSCFYIVFVCQLNVSTSEISRFHIYKENQDTHEALGDIGNMLGIQGMNKYT